MLRHGTHEDGNGTVDRERYYWTHPGIDHQVGFVDVDGEGNPTYYFFLTDHVGSVLAVADSDGNIVNQYDYDAFGNLIEANSFETVPNRYRFHGREWDEHRNEYYYRYRNYVPEWGSFTSPDLNCDPYESEGACNYLFCSNNPVSATDPLGLDDSYGCTMFQSFFPATAHTAGARPFTGSIQGDMQHVYANIYPTLALPLAPLREPHVQGGLKTVGSGAETLIGVGGLFVASPTILGSIVSGAALLHGLDGVQSGFRQMITGMNTPSYTARGITYITGDEKASELFDAGLCIGLSLGSGWLTQGSRTTATGGRVTQFYSTSRGAFAPGSATAPSKWVAPAAAREMNWFQRLMTGRPWYRHYVEFDVAAGELGAAPLPKSFLANWQQVLTTEANLSGRNPVWGTLCPNYEGFSFLLLLGSEAGRGYYIQSNEEEHK